MKVVDLMSRPVISVTPEATVVEIARTLLDHHISGVPVVDGTGAVIGIVTESDVVVRNANVQFPTFLQVLDARIYLSNTRRFEEELRRALGATAREVMSRKVLTVAPDDDVTVASTLMVDKHVHPIPVVDGGRLIGIISRRDIIRHILAQETGDPAIEESREGAT